MFVFNVHVLEEGIVSICPNNLVGNNDMRGSVSFWVLPFFV